MLQAVDARKLGFAETPLQIRVATQRSAAGARRVDQHTVALTVQSLYPYVGFVANHDRMNVGQSAALKSRSEAGKPPLVDVERIKPPGRTHQRSQCQRLSARTRAKVDHHFAAAWLQQSSD